MHTFQCKIFAISAIYFRRLSYIMTNDKKLTLLSRSYITLYIVPCCYLLKVKNKKCQNMKRLPHTFNFLKVTCISVHPYIFHFYVTVLFWNNILLFLDETKHTCYKIYDNFKLSTLHLHTLLILSSA